MPTPGVPGGPRGRSTHGGGVLAQLHAAIPLLQGFIGADRRVRDLGRCRQRVRAGRASPPDLGPGSGGAHIAVESGVTPFMRTTGQLTSHTGPGSPRKPAEARGRLSSVRWDDWLDPAPVPHNPSSQVTLHFPILDPT